MCLGMYPEMSRETPYSPAYLQTASTIFKNKKFKNKREKKRNYFLLKHHSEKNKTKYSFDSFQQHSLQKISIPFDNAICID